MNEVGGMRHDIDDKKLANQLMRRKLLVLLGLTLLVGCDDTFEEEKEKLMINPEHGKEIEKNGQKYRVFVVGGIRFVVPASHQVTPVDPDGFNINLVWPNIPPGKVPDTQIKSEPVDVFGNMPTNIVNVIVRTEPGRMGRFDSYPAWTSPDLIAHDDSRLGLRIFIHKDVSQQKIDYGFYNEAYSLEEDVRTPYSNEPVVIGSGLISFMYTQNIYVRLSMNGWNTKMNPDWKGIYLGLVETLNNYQEEGKK